MDGIKVHHRYHGARGAAPRDPVGGRGARDKARS